MNRYLYTLATLLDYKSEVKNKYTPEIIISGLFNDHLTEIDWILTLSELELVYGFEIPGELFDRTDMSLGEFANELSQLPVISEELYPEFMNIKFKVMDLTKRYIEMEGKDDAKSIREMNKINQKFDELSVELNLLLEYENKNYLLN
ncbi:MAG: hypothetical protein DAHOPDDO_00064 [Ignavibacteriaceae bacterium]|nr:hypothetical protein [Ignavibacteriaceae bacterium]